LIVPTTVLGTATGSGPGLATLSLAAPLPVAILLPLALQGTQAALPVAVRTASTGVLLACPLAHWHTLAALALAQEPALPACQ
jgi:hypothetical protein